MYDPSLHLFIDDDHVRDVFALQRVFHQPVKHPIPVLEDIPSRNACWASVLQEADGKFRIWYQSFAIGAGHDMATAGVWGRGEELGFFPERMENAVRETQTSVISYAESMDGLQWEKPELGLIDWQGSKANNIVLDGAAAAQHYNYRLTNMDTVSVLRDDADPDPQKRYKLICHWETIHCWDNYMSNLGRSQEYMDQCWKYRAKYLNTSPDGIHWEQVPVWIKGCAGGGDYAGVTRDERNKQYWFNDRAPGGLEGIGYRTSGLCVSEDLYHWPERVEKVFPMSEYEDYGLRYEHHGMVPFNYGDQDLGFLELSIGGKPIASILSTHRDGRRWQRPTPTTPFLSIGPKGAHDDTIVAATRNAPFRVGDRLYIFYNSRHYAEHVRESSISLATLRLDGFAGLKVDGYAVERHKKPAQLATQRFEIRENELQINIEGHGGSARVALLDENLQPFPGCELKNCLPIEEDAVRAPVRWQGRTDLAALKGQQAHVLVQLTSGTLYAVRL